MTYLTSIPMSHPLFHQSRWFDAQWVHRKVMSAFGEIADSESPRALEGILFRVEPEVASGRVLVQSGSRPALSDVRVSELSPLLQSLSGGMQVRFRLRANAVRTVNHTTDGVTRRHRALVGAGDLPKWLAAKVPGLTFDESQLRVTTSYTKFGSTPLYVADFAGRATIADVASTCEALTQGVGKARSYGCGLLSVVPERVV